ncbi:MAG: hypothetical protein DHS20C18_13050 [Saprospiraceae bacterium]|nr:MAG: hypothetical protein DHS20C18_13050 [Saprospiraceae bacterium]
MTRQNKTATLFSALFILLLFSACAEKAPKENWISLFNGKDLTGWDIKISGYELNNNYKNTFLVEDSLLKVSYTEYDTFAGEFGHLFYKEPFSHYILRVEYRFVGDQVKGGPGWAYRNNGAMLHCQTAASMGLDQDFPVSMEAQLLGGNGTDERPTGNLCTPGTHVEIDGKLVTDHCINSTSKTYHGDQWVTMDMIVLGDSLIQHVVNGDTVLTYSHIVIGGAEEGYPVPEGTPVKEGYISLQAETAPIEFRKVELLNLKGEK